MDAKMPARERQPEGFVRSKPPPGAPGSSVMPPAQIEPPPRAPIDQPPEEPLSPRPEPPPSDEPPKEPLPSQLKSTPPELEPPLSEVEQARRFIAEFGQKWPVTIELLYKPIFNDKGELINSLTFREPRASDINRIGNPIRATFDGSDFIIEERKMTYIMGALTGVLPPLLEAMNPRDWHTIAIWLRNFFLPDFRGIPKSARTIE